MILSLITLTCNAQDISQLISFDKTTINYGKRVTWYRGSDQFRFKNNSNDTLYFIQSKQSEQMKTYLPKEGIPPGQYGFIEAIYNPKRKGQFEEEILVLSNLSNDWISLHLKGKILLFDNSNQLSCPSFTKEGLAVEEYKKASVPLNQRIECIVLDERTGERLSNAFVYFHQQTSARAHNVISGVKGICWPKLQLGYYDLEVYKEGYESKEINQFLLDEEVNQIVLKLRKSSTIEFSDSLFSPNQLVLLLDASTSMSPFNLFPIVKESIIRSLPMLRTQDKIALFTYSDSLTQIRSLSDTTTFNYQTIQELKTSGNTNGSDAILSTYKYLLKASDPNKVNHLILFTDGSFTDIQSEKNKALNQLKRISSKGKINLSLILFGGREKNEIVLEFLQKNLQAKTYYIKHDQSAYQIMQKAIMDACRK